MSLAAFAAPDALSLSGRRWEHLAGEERIGLAIAQRLGVPDIIGRLLAGRGIGIEQAEAFLTPTLRAWLPDPSCFTDMDRAAGRLADAVQAGETVAVFGDYDVDGACSGALLADVLRRLGCAVISYVPDRLSEGYGPNPAALAGLEARGARLIVCVDCGISAHAAFGALNGQTEAIVLDHHKAEGPPPAIFATVNPNRLDDQSGLHHICAAAVTFITLVGMLRSLRQRGYFAQRAEPDLRGYLDLVALATVCDVMPLTGLNRAFVTQGLAVMGRRARPGIAALLEVAQAKDAPSAMTCGFALGPRINAAGRIHECDMGLKLLLEPDRLEAQRIAAQLDDINRQRQAVEAGILDEAMASAAAQIAEGLPVVVVAGAGWHPGVVGIVAGRIKEKFNRPACVAGLAGGVAKGSGRSIAGLDLGAAVIAARQSGLLTTGGGHAMAAGFALPADKVGAFHEFLCARLNEAALMPAQATLQWEAALTVPAANVALAEMVSKLGPFGAGNPEPMFVVLRARVTKADRIGKEGNTIRAFLTDESGGRLKALLFRGKEGALADALLRVGGAPLNIAGHLRAESWNGSVSAGFFVVDAAPA
ncbi:MAG: single-stranded-DNA-specific exonuclease RecJ [Rhodospirillales bacterium 20-60-12]|nr:MAG: single-stranded-DNA-specific exonuclease RecJ [Rhodospirillales bacterium 20-60-12]HQT67313.1 single-stranded-DNA-specific exonuclease RecJ [Acetobacteraceae bacterium]HQU01142.1 single-stranded-DNA-specific exonuclease RecJ [Acetobacteraceae bacterium]